MRIQEVVIDCAEPERLAGFWAQILQTRAAAHDERWSVVDAGPLLLAFQQVPEPKSSPKNRVHLDIEVPDADAAVARAEGLGAHRTGQREQDADGNGYVVMRDPEGNEFCFVQDRGGRWEAHNRRLLAGEG